MATNRRPEPRPRRLAALLAAALLLGAAPAAAAPSEPPRRFEYRVAWNGIPAAGAIVAVTVSYTHLTLPTKA
jgi:hypothetical protein